MSGPLVHIARCKYGKKTTREQREEAARWQENYQDGSHSPSLKIDKAMTLGKLNILT